MLTCPYNTWDFKMGSDIEEERLETKANDGQSGRTPEGLVPERSYERTELLSSQEGAAG